MIFIVIFTICTITYCYVILHIKTHQFSNFLHKINTHPHIILIFQRALSYQRPASFYRISQTIGAEFSIQQAAQQQDLIGWHNFFKGHLASTWKSSQLTYFKQHFLFPPSVDSWLKQIILQIYEFSFSMWNNRNQILHQREEEHLNSQQAQKLEDEILTSYSIGPGNVLPMHHFMFEQSLSSILAQTVSEKRYWLLTILASRQCFSLQNLNFSHENDSCSIEKQFATVPD